jgi:diadenylate cyclase
MSPQLCTELCWTFQTSFSATSLIDIVLVTVIFFVASLLLRGTQAITLIRGMVIIVLVAGLVATAFPFIAFRWLLGNIVTAAIVAIPVIFQPELRRALERVGRAGSFLGGRNREMSVRMQIIEAISQTCVRLAERRQGALIVLERNISLQEYIDTGIVLEAEVTAQLLLTIFWVKTELHDGAVIIRDGRIAAAACVLPLSSGRNMTDRKMGTRHRAGLGISEVSDCVCVIVSEETSQISITNAGRMIRKVDVARLKTILEAFYGDPVRQPRLASLLSWVRKSRAAQAER